MQVTVYSYIGDTVCIQQRPLLEKNIIKGYPRENGKVTSPLWDRWVREAKQKGHKVQPGGNGRPALLALSAIPEDYKKKVEDAFGKPSEVAHPMEAFFSLDASARIAYESFTFEDGTYLKKEQITRYTLNASVLNAIPAFYRDRDNMRRRAGHSGRGVWQSVVADVVSFSAVLEKKYGMGHSIKATRLHKKLKEYQNEGYLYLVDGRNRNKSAAKVEASDERMALLEQLIKDPANFNNEQVCKLYNTTASVLKWPNIVRQTVHNHRVKLGLHTEAGNHGLREHRDRRAMQVKRKAPSVSMAYWTMDGWDAELLYQDRTKDGKGHMVTTYHNRLTVVVVLDPVAKIKYPIGYAIGTHETPALIREALRNAVNHTRELFGQRYKPLQLQTDRYSKKSLTPLYEAVSGIYTPAEAGNAKSKVVEPYFSYLNSQCQLFFPRNWSGHNVDANRDNQPNADYLNKVRHNFPDAQGCYEQIVKLMETERATKREQYLEYWEKLPVADRLPMSNAEYLYLFGETHTHTCRMGGPGFMPTLQGQQITYDTFDTQFRELAYMDWAVKYDPDDLDTILVLDARSESSTRKLQEIIGQYRFELTAKYVEPMAIYDRKEGDGAQLSRIKQFNKSLELYITERSQQNHEKVTALFASNPALNDTLTKMVLCDSNGQHKDQKNLQRKQAQIPSPAASLPEDDYEIMEDDIRDEYGKGF